MKGWKRLVESKIKTKERETLVALSLTSTQILVRALQLGLAKLSCVYRVLATYCF